MYVRRITSPTGDRAERMKIYQDLLASLARKGHWHLWLHVEVVAPRGWFINMLLGREPWMEVSRLDEDTWQLNPGVPKKKRPTMPRVSASWQSNRDGTWNVPTCETDTLLDWMDTCLAVITGRDRFRVSGWLDG